MYHRYQLPFTTLHSRASLPPSINAAPFENPMESRFGDGRPNNHLIFLQHTLVLAAAVSKNNPKLNGESARQIVKSASETRGRRQFHAAGNYVSRNCVLPRVTSSRRWHVDEGLGVGGGWLRGWVVRGVARATGEILVTNLFEL